MRAHTDRSTHTRERDQTHMTMDVAVFSVASVTGRGKCSVKTLVDTTNAIVSAARGRGRQRADTAAATTKTQQRTNVECRQQERFVRGASTGTGASPLRVGTLRGHQLCSRRLGKLWCRNGCHRHRHDFAGFRGTLHPHRLVPVGRTRKYDYRLLSFDFGSSFDSKGGLLQHVGHKDLLARSFVAAFYNSLSSASCVVSTQSESPLSRFGAAPQRQRRLSAIAWPLLAAHAKSLPQIQNLFLNSHLSQFKCCAPRDRSRCR